MKFNLKTMPVKALQQTHDQIVKADWWMKKIRTSMLKQNIQTEDIDLIIGDLAIMLTPFQKELDIRREQLKTKKRTV